jgi:glycosyltransferase involved in cell wall biosynthesis
MANRVPLSVIVPTRNEASNLARCLAQVRGWADQVIVVDSRSKDGTATIAERYGATVVQFHYQGGWPKKRQWLLDSFAFRNDWILLLDADEMLTEPLRQEIAAAIAHPDREGYEIPLQVWFLGRCLRFGDTRLWKRCLFRQGKGRFECRLAEQTADMADIEVHEQMLIDGLVGRLQSPLRHENIASLARYFAKHNEYSTWEAHVWHCGTDNPADLARMAPQARLRRTLKSLFLSFPGAPLLMFFYKYVVRLGFLDGRPGFIYCALMAQQIFHVKIKMYELCRAAASPARHPDHVRSYPKTEIRTQ